MSSINFYWKSTCTTCRKARSFLINAGVTMNERDLAKKPFTKNEVIELLAGRNASSFVNPKSTPYKALGLQNKNLTEEEIIDLLSQEVNLFKRPFIIKQDLVLFGFSEAEYKKLLD